MKNTILILILFASIALGFTSCVKTVSESETHSQTFTLGETSYSIDNVFVVYDFLHQYEAFDGYYTAHEYRSAIILSQCEIQGNELEGRGVGIVFHDNSSILPGTYSLSYDPNQPLNHFPMLIFTELESEDFKLYTSYDIYMNLNKMLNLNYFLEPDFFSQNGYDSRVYIATSGSFTLEVVEGQFIITTDDVEVARVDDLAIVKSCSVDYKGGALKYYLSEIVGGEANSKNIVTAGWTTRTDGNNQTNIVAFFTEDEEMAGFISTASFADDIPEGTYSFENCPIFYKEAGAGAPKFASSGEITVTRDGDFYVIDASGLVFNGMESPTSLQYVGTLSYIDLPLDDLDFEGLIPSYYLPIDGYGESNGGWSFIASPVGKNILPTAVGNLINNIDKNNYDLYRFNQSATAEWENYKAHTDDFVFENGKGYLYANKYNANLAFLGTTNSSDQKTVNLEYDPNARFKGWNLVGNPFTVPAVVDRSFYTMNESGTGLVPQPVSAGETIAAGAGIMVKADGANDTVTFTTPTRQATANNGLLRIAVGKEDQIIVSFNPGDQLGKFYFGKQNANLYFPQDHEEYAIAYSEQIGEMPVNFKARKNGEYTITVNSEAVEMEYLHLIDNLTGKDIDLLETPSYTFTAKTDDYASRFKLVFDTDGNTNDDEEAFAFVSDGNIIITTDACDATLQVIDIQGRIIRTVGLPNCDNRTITGMTPGVYVLRLINGEKVRVQKIVVE